MTPKEKLNKQKNNSGTGAKDSPKATYNLNFFILSQGSIYNNPIVVINKHPSRTGHNPLRSQFIAYDSILFLKK